MRLIVKYKDQSQAVHAIQNKLGAIVLFLDKSQIQEEKNTNKPKVPCRKYICQLAKKKTQILNACKMITC